MLKDSHVVYVYSHLVRVVKFMMSPKNHHVNGNDAMYELSENVLQNINEVITSLEVDDYNDGSFKMFDQVDLFRSIWKKQNLLLYNFFGKIFNEPNQTNGDAQGFSIMNPLVVDQCSFED